MKGATEKNFSIAAKMIQEKINTENQRNFYTTADKSHCDG